MDANSESKSSKSRDGAADSKLSNMPITSPVISPGLSDRFCILNFGSASPSLTASSPMLTPRGLSRTSSPNISNNIRVIASDENIALRIEQERKRARGSIYSQRSRDKTRVAATALRLQNEIAQIQGEIHQLDSQLHNATNAQQTVPAALSTRAAPSSSSQIPAPFTREMGDSANSSSRSSQRGSDASDAAPRPSLATQILATYSRSAMQDGSSDRSSDRSDIWCSSADNSSEDKSSESKY